MLHCFQIAAKQVRGLRMISFRTDEPR